MAFKRKSKTMSILLTLAMLFMLWPGVALAGDPGPVDTISVTSKNDSIDTVANTVYGGSELTAVFPASEGESTAVCEISTVPATPYTSLDAALDAVVDGQTITLLTDINHNSGIEIEEMSVAFNLNGHTLNVTNASASGSGLIVTNGAVTLMGDSGSFNVTGSSCGVQAYNSAVTVTNATATGNEATNSGVWANTGSSITVKGNATATYGKGASAVGGIIVIKGNAEGGAHASGPGSSIVIEGNATATGSGAGVYAESGAEITVNNVNSGMSSEGGAKAAAGSEITINGTITALSGYYIRVENVAKTVDNKDDSSSKSGYFQYSATDVHTSKVWVKDTTIPTGTTGDPVWSYQSPLPTSSYINNMKVLENKFWAVGKNGTLLKYEGDWEKIDIGAIGAELFSLEGITYGDGTYMLVGRLDDYASVIYTSANGTTWTQKAVFPHNLEDVAFGGGKFVAVGRPGKIMVSSDNGESWQSITPVYPTKRSYYLQSITYADGKFVAVGMGSVSDQDKGGIMTSVDGVTWSFPYTNANYSIYDVAYGNSTFVAVGGKDSGASLICTSSDGTIWAEQSTAYSNLYSVEFAGGKFVAAGRTNPYTSSQGFTATSANGTVWSGNTTSGLSGFNTLASDGTIWMAAGGIGNIYKSYDGANWEYVTKGATKTLNDVAYNGTDLYVAVGVKGTIQTSLDGVNWTSQTSGNTNDLNKVDYLNGQFVAVGKGGTILTSDNGTIWMTQTSGTTKELKGLAYGGSKYVVVGGDASYNPVVLTSDNGTTWSSVSNDPAFIGITFVTVTYGDEVFMALMQNGQVYRSVNGTNWVKIDDLPGSGIQYPTDLIYAGGKFAVAGGYGKIYLSSDKGDSWTIINSQPDSYSQGIAYGGGNYVAVGEVGKIMASVDGGTTWRLQPSGLKPNHYSSDNYIKLNGITAGDNGFVAVGENGLVLQSEDFTVSDDSDAHDVAIVRTALGINNILGSGSNDNAFRIVADMNLITSTTVAPSIQADISWQSSQSTVISNTGTVNRPAFEDGDQVVYLTATFTKNAAVDTKTFIVRVLANTAGALTDTQRVAAAKAALVDGSVTVPIGAHQAAKTVAVQSYVNGLLAAVPDATGVTATVSYNSGTGKYDVTLVKGSASDSKSLAMTVTESVDPDIAIVNNAKTAAENATYSNMTQAAASSENAIKTPLRNIAVSAVNNGSVNVAVNTVSYTPPVAGTSADPSGTNGSYTFTITVSKGTQSQTTTQKTITITATAYTSPSSGGGGSSSSTPSGILVTPDGKDASDSGVALSFPAGAVESDIRVQVREASLTSGMDLPEDSQLISQVVNIIKDKSGDFSEPVTITMSFNKSQIDPDKYDIKICYFDEENGEWVELDNIEVDLTKSTVSGEVTHFTKFAVIATLKEVEPEVTPQPPVPPAAKLPADIIGHWAKDSIAKLVQAGIVSGYPDGTFQPDKTVTRAEFTVMLVKALKLESKSGTVFADSTNHWAKDSISTAAAHGIISGYDQNSFGPDDNITREQAAVIIARAAKLQAEDQKLSFSDAQQISPWALSSITAAVSKSYLGGYPDNSFRPQGKLTRAEAAAIISKLL